MDPGMLMVLEMKTYIEHREVEKVRHKDSGVTYRLSDSLLDTTRMLDVHARTHHERIGNPVWQHPEPYSHQGIDPKRNGPKDKEDGQLPERFAAQASSRGQFPPEMRR